MQLFLFLKFKWDYLFYLLFLKFSLLLISRLKIVICCLLLKHALEKRNPE